MRIEALSLNKFFFLGELNIIAENYTQDQMDHIRPE